MPIALLKAYVAMLPRLVAEEQLARVDAGVLAFGLVEPSDRQRAIVALEQQTKGPQAKARPAKAEPADLAAMGIAVKSTGGTLPTIGSLEEWLGQSPSGSAVVGDQERG
jgi:hypothetical protein